jgi:superfamily II DNA or RNA helicase
LPPDPTPPALDVVKIHSAFRDGKFLVWGEVDPRKVSSRHLPFSASPARTVRAMAQVADQKLPAAAEPSLIWLPSIEGEAIAPGLRSQDQSKTWLRIRPWTLSTAVLSVESAYRFLDSCNRNPSAESWDTKLAHTTRFWAAALRFVADLALRDRYIPSLAAEGEKFYARWRPLLSAPDQARLRQMARAMPPAAHAITPAGVKTPPEDDPAILLTAFVSWMMDFLPRLAGRSRYSPAPNAVKWNVQKGNIEALWIAGLRSMESEIPAKGERMAAFAAKVDEWQRPVIREAEAPWMLAFELREPDETAADASSWQVRYRMESAHGGPPIPFDSVPARYTARLLSHAATICGDVRVGADSFPLDITGAFRFLTETASLLEQQGFRVVVPEWWRRREIASLISARPVVKPVPDKLAVGGSPTMFSLGDLMKYDWEVAIGGENYTREELDRLAESAAPLAKVHGKWVPLDPASIRKALELWKNEPVSARDAIRMALGAVDVPRDIQFEDARGEGWIGELLGKLSGHARFEELDAPAGFHGTLRPYQLRGFSWLGFLRQYGLGACLADDMGLGKTIQALALLERERANGVDRPVLLICPTSVVGNWHKEAARFAPGLSVMVHHGQARSRGEEFVVTTARQSLVISSYALVHRDLDVLKEVAWSGIILDEAQNIKNPETRQARAIRSLNADYRIALTGTPVENNVGELWSIMDFLNPGFLGNQADFRRRFLLPIQKQADSIAAEQLRTLTAPFILRRLKSDSAIIQDLPDKMEMKVFCNLTPEQATLYRSVVDEAGRALESAEGIKRKGVILATLTKLKQVCNHPAHFLGDKSSLAGRSGKLSRLTEMAEELLAEGDRALIFSQFTEMGEQLQSHLSSTFGQEVLFLHGGVPAAKRDKMVARFQHGGKDDPRLFVLSLKAGGTGLNLTAANHVFHFDRWWNPAVENQATDRAFRIGQKRNVQIHKFVCIGTVEERIDEMIERKKAVADKVIGTGEAWLTELSTSEIKSLFALRQEAIS